MYAYKSALKLIHFQQDDPPAPHGGEPRLESTSFKTSNFLLGYGGKKAGINLQRANRFGQQAVSVRVTAMGK